MTMSTHGFTGSVAPVLMQRGTNGTEHHGRYPCLTRVPESGGRGVMRGLACVNGWPARAVII